jgi:hypothetical protein
MICGVQTQSARWDDALSRTNDWFKLSASQSRNVLKAGGLKRRISMRASAASVHLPLNMLGRCVRAECGKW